MPSAAGYSREIYPLWWLRRYVLQRVYGEVYPAGKEGLVELAGEDVALVDDGERSVGLALACGPDDADLDLDADGAQASCALFSLH